MAMNWSEGSDRVLNDLSAQFKAKYKVQVKALLADPLKFASQQNISATISNMKEDLDDYVAKQLDAMKNEKRDLDNSLMKSDAMTKQLGQNISMQAKQNRIPLVTSAAVERGSQSDEVIYISSVDEDVLALVQKLVASSTYIIDRSVKYREYMIGEWDFSGSRSYDIKVYLPQNPALDMQASKDELDALMDYAKSYIEASAAGPE